MNGHYGLLGEKLGHSFSPAIHKALGGYDYELVELPREELGDWLRKTDFRGVNVTIPYKQDVIPFLDSLSERAAKIGAVNTIVRGADGRLRGYNTDWGGFDALARRTGIDPRGMKCLVLGSGGASKTAVCCLRDRGAAEVRVVSRKGEDNYENLSRHADADLLVNATPVGMYPKNGASPVSLSAFPKLKGVLDLIYNPARTALLLQAEERGIPCANGLFMLVEQARIACGLFLGKEIPESRTAEVTRELARETANIVLIGMPGCGKSTVGRLLAEKTGKRFVDTDAEIERIAGMKCGDLIRRQGEEAFRALESRVIREAGAATGCVVATGGGAVTRPENRDPLRQNGKIAWLDRPLDALPTDPSRPLSEDRALLEKRWKERKPLYEAWADVAVRAATPEEAVGEIMKNE